MPRPGRVSVAVLASLALAGAPAKSQALRTPRSAQVSEQMDDGELKRLAGDAKGAADSFEEAARQARAGGDADSQWEALLEAASARRDAGEPSAGVVDAFQALQVAQQKGEAVRIARSQLFLAGMYGHTKDLPNALLYYEAAATTLAQAGQGGLAGMARLAAGDAASSAGDWKAAADWYQRTALSFRGAGGVPAIEAAALQRAALAWEKAGDARHAKTSAQTARATAKAARAEAAILQAYEAAGDVSRDAGRTPEAIALWEAGIAEAKRQGSTEAVRFTLRIASATWKGGDHAKAEQLLKEAEDDAAKSQDVPRLGRIAAVRGALLADDEKYADARPILESAERKLVAGGEPVDRATAQEALGLCFAGTGAWTDAEAAFSRAAASYKESGDPEGQARTLAKGMLAQYALGNQAGAQALGKELADVSTREGVSVPPAELTKLLALSAAARPMPTTTSPASQPTPPAPDPIVEYSPPWYFGIGAERTSLHSPGIEYDMTGGYLSLGKGRARLEGHVAATEPGPYFWEAKLAYGMGFDIAGPFSLHLGVAAGGNGITEGTLPGEWRLPAGPFAELEPTLNVHLTGSLGLHFSAPVRWFFTDARRLPSGLFTDKLKANDVALEGGLSYWIGGFGLKLGYRIAKVAGGDWKTLYGGIAF